VVRRYLTEAPGRRADMHLTDSFVDIASSGHDVAVRIGPVDGKTLRIVSLGRCPMRVVASPNLAASLGAVNAPPDVAGLPCLTYSSWRAPSEWTFERPGKRLTVRVGGHFSSTHLPSLRSAAREGLGLANLPLWLIKEDLRDGRLVPLLGEWTVLDQPIHAVLPPGRHTPNRTRVFVDLLKRHLREEAEGG
jgi:DNA-binding transcriptional LysR family regulator